MDNNEFFHESFNYDQFLGENTDDYHTMTCVELKNRTTGIKYHALVEHFFSYS